MKYIIYILVTLLLVGAVYVSATSQVTGELLKPASIGDIFKRISEYDFKTKSIPEMKKELSAIWNYIPEYNFEEDSNTDWTFWDETKKIWNESLFGKFFNTWGYFMNVAIWFCWDILSSIVLVIQVISWFFTGVPYAS